MAKALKFQKLKKKHYKDMYEYGSNEEVTKFLSWGPFKNEKESLDSIKKLKKSFDQIFAITVHGKMIGTCAIKNIETKTIEVGYVIHQDFQGMGIGNKSLTFLINFATFWHKDKKMIAKIDKKNIASIALVKSCGLTKMNKKNEKFVFYYININ
jgi:ribosomal-protein-alanine N-acetyltransferase